jgi:hypothetical protein
MISAGDAYTIVRGTRPNLVYRPLLNGTVGLA